MTEYIPETTGKSGEFVQFVHIPRRVVGQDREAIRNRSDILRLRKTNNNENYVTKALEKGFDPEVINLYFEFTIGTIND